LGRLLFSFSGRLSRLRYFLLSLVTAALASAAAAVVMIGVFAHGARVSEPAMIACAAILVAVSIIGLSLTVRRLHDLDLAGWWVLAIWIAPAAVEGALYQLADSPKLASTLSGALTLAIGLWLWFMPGTRGANRFGPDPRSTAA
jgi:uncharacterized membrane protein YhaH (DUF805 family)